MANALGPLAKVAGDLLAYFRGRRDAKDRIASEYFALVAQALDEVQATLEKGGDPPWQAGHHLKGLLAQMADKTQSVSGLSAVDIDKWGNRIRDAVMTADHLDYHTIPAAEKKAALADMKRLVGDLKSLSFELKP